MVVVVFYSPSLTPTTPCYHIFLRPLSCDTTAFLPRFWRCSILHFRQVEVWLPMQFCPLHCFFVCLAVERWVEGRQVRHLSSPPSWLAPMEWFLLQLLYWYLSPFARHRGLSGSFTFLNNSGTVLFVEPHFPIGILVMSICSVAHFLGVLPLVHSISLKTCLRFDAAHQLT